MPSRGGSPRSAPLRHSLSVLRIHPAKPDGGQGVVPPEKHPAGTEESAALGKDPAKPGGEAGTCTSQGFSRGGLAESIWGAAPGPLGHRHQLHLEQLGAPCYKHRGQSSRRLQHGFVLAGQIFRARCELAACAQREPRCRAPPAPAPAPGRHSPYFLWMSVSVMPCSVTLKCTRVGVGSVSSSKVEEMAFWMAGAPASVSMLTELRYRTLHSAGTARRGLSKGRVSPRPPTSPPSVSPCPARRHSPPEQGRRPRVRFVAMQTQDGVTQKFFASLF